MVKNLTPVKAVKYISIYCWIRIAKSKNRLSNIQLYEYLNSNLMLTSQVIMKDSTVSRHIIKQRLPNIFLLSQNNMLLVWTRKANKKKYSKSCTQSLNLLFITSKWKNATKVDINKLVFYLLSVALRGQLFEPKLCFCGWSEIHCLNTDFERNNF